MNLIFIVVLSLIGCVIIAKYCSKRNALKPDGAGCLLWWNNTVLLMERNPDYINNARRAHELEFPGGTYDPSLDSVPFYDTALREVREEAGIELNIKQYQSMKRPFALRPSTQQAL